MMNTLLALILVLVLVQALPTPASAANTKVTACANKKTGVLRLATPKCTSKERKVSWGITGPKGAKGSTGPAGVAETLTTKTIYYYDPSSTTSCPTYDALNVVTSVRSASGVNPLFVNFASVGLMFGDFVQSVGYDSSANLVASTNDTINCSSATVYIPAP
jgi:hypothetical protein